MSFVFNPIDPEFLRDPYPTYARLRGEGPLYRHPAGFHVVPRHAAVVEVLRDAETFSSRAMGGMSESPQIKQMSPTGGSLIGYDPPKHTRHRSIVNRGFTPRRIAALEPRIRKVAEELLADFESAGSCDLMASFANPLPVTVIAELLGLDAERRDDFKRWSTDLIVGSTRPDAARGPRALEGFRAFRAYMTGFVERRRRDPQDDLVSILVHAEQEEGILDADEVVGFAGLLLAAGSETTTNLIGNAILAALEHPDQLAAVRADPSRVPAWIEESLRYDAPVQLVMRLSTRETEVGGAPLAKNSFVMPLLASANRDDAWLPDAARFDVARRPQGHLAFGLGHHFCLGASLARLETRIALELVLERLPELRLATEDPVPRHGSFLIRGPASLPLRWTTRGTA